MLRDVCATIVAVAMQEVLTYSECVFVALGIQHAMHMQYVFICGLLSSTVFFFFTLSHKWHDFFYTKNLIECQMCVLISSATFV